MNTNQCEQCLNYSYDMEVDEYYCAFHFDQDEYEKLLYSKRVSCPYFRAGNEYTIVKKQAFK